MSSTFAQLNSQSAFEKQPVRSLVFIDSGVKDYESIAAGVLPGQQVVILDSTKNGIEQITSEIEKYASTKGAIDSVHIFSHGNSGSLQLGSATLNADNLSQYESQLQGWRNALSDQADIVLYGCDVAAGSGSDFVDRLGELTGADIAASSDRTGRGGNWNLEFAKGDIEAPLALTPEAMADYRGTLATITVTNNNDSGPGSLRSAIASAATGDTIQFASTLASQTITLTSGQLVINKNLTIDASAAINLTISGNNASRVMLTEGSTNVTLKNLIVANGKVLGTDLNNEVTSAGGGIQTGGNSTLTLENCQVNNNVAGYAGGIYAGFKSTTNVLNSTFTGNDGRSANSERGGGAISTKSGGSLTVKGSTFTNNKGINGGAINHLLGNLTVENSTFLNNDSTAGTGANTSGYGGAIYTDGANASGPNSTPGSVGGTIAIRNSRFEGNKGAGQGGGMFLFVYPPDKIIVEGSTIVNNQVVKSSNGDALGGGLRIGNGEFTISNTTFSNNLAQSQGGALWVGEKSPGTIINSTFAGNKAENTSGTSGLGGAIVLNTSESISIVNSTIAKNSAGFQGGAFWGGGLQTTLKNTIVANNTANNGGNSWNIKQNAGNSKFSDGGGNFQWPAKNPNDSSDFNVTDAVTIADPKLDVLQTINGFSVMPLLAGSPAIDKGIAAGAPAADQRGVSRPQDGDGNGSAIVDSGSFELGGTVVPVPTPTPAPTLSGSLGQTNNYSSVNDLITKWPNAAQNQGIKLSGIAFDGAETDYLNPNVISNLTLASNENPKSWMSYGSIGGIGVPSSYDGWFTDAKKIRAEINHNPNTNQSQALKVKWADNQDITSTTIDLAGLTPKTSPDLGDQGNEVAFLQIFNNGVLVPATKFTIARLNAPSAPKPITVSSDGVTFIGDRTDGSFQFKIDANSLGDATFDELRFSTKAYDSPTAAYVATPFKSDGSDYLVGKIEYQGISNIDTNAVPPTFFSYGSSPDPIIDGGSGVVTINRTGNTSVSASVDYLIVAPSVGQPVNNVDYNISPFAVNPSSGTVNFNPGQTSVSLTINNLPGLAGGVVNLGLGPGSSGASASTAITLL
ncbi:DUF4347 domain-containing protein [Microcoleus sp. D3_18a_C4]|uniref:DUF4347 domain-containing protein n=1 Tax=Microcoleus sp. D3_18a_C4 TaxID=3055332 RepID=UPI002FD752A4